MKVVEMGRLAAYNGKFTGMLIEATVDELRDLETNILYEDCAVVPVGSDGKPIQQDVRTFDQYTMIANQIARCGEICARLNADRRKKYSATDVEAIIDELLDGVKPEGGDK